MTDTPEDPADDAPAGPVEYPPENPPQATGEIPLEAATEGTPGGPPEHRRRRRLSVVLRPMLSIAAVVLIVEFLLLPALHRSRTSFRNLVHINAAYLILGVGLEVASLLAYARLTQAVLPGRKVPFFTLLRIDMSTFAISHLVPGGTVAGAALGYRLLDAEDVGYTDATFALGTQGIGSAVVLNVIFWGALIISIPLHGVTHNIGYLYRAAAVVGALLLTLAGGLIFFLTSGRDWAASAIHRVALRVPFINAERVEAALRTLADHLSSLARNRKLLVRAIVWAAANWALDAASLWVFLRGFGVSALAPYLLVAYGLAYVLAVIPITPAGLGVVETALIVVLKGFGYSSPGVGLGVLSYRVVNFLLPIPVGGASYLSLTLHRAVIEAREEEKPPPTVTGTLRKELRGVVDSARQAAHHRSDESPR